MPDSKLSNFASLEYSFDQGALVPMLNRNDYGSDAEFQNAQRGVCTSLVALWLKEKLTTTTASSGPVPTRFVGTSSNLANLQLVQQAAQYQLIYHSALADLDAMFTAMGLLPNRVATLQA
jgi:hypothetical protein